jgi:hypothetical protein
MAVSGIRSGLPLGLSALSVLALGALAWTEEGADERGPVDFSRDVRPILSNRCFLCHGPDEGRREADLRFDLEAEALADRGGYAAIVPGDSATSELILRITDPDDPMPPKGEGPPLTEAEIETLRRWIDEGAGWEQHWAYVPPTRPARPAVNDASWPRGPLDAFVLARLEAEGLVPEEEASREALIRRVTLDVTGLPPTIEEIDAFLADETEDAYARLVDRLLASPRYGEHMARSWLDAARYGDTHGLSLDNERSIWPYRDWVIDAFNRNLPYDRFTIEQLAGDLLPEPTRDQLIATGFNRCNPTTSEAGVIDEEYFVKYTLDRVDTTATVWMGTTMSCAQCHDHKFDPITQKEFYEFFGFFVNIDGPVRDGNVSWPAPTLAIPTAEDEAALAALDARIAETERELDRANVDVDAAQEAWAAELADRLAQRWSPLERREAPEGAGATATIFLRTRGPVSALRLSLEGAGAEAAAAVMPEVGLPGPDGAFVPLAFTLLDPTPSGVLHLVARGATEVGPDTVLALRVPGAGPEELARLSVSASPDPALAEVELGRWSTVGPFAEPARDRAASHGPEEDPARTTTYGPDALAWTSHPNWERERYHKVQHSDASTYFQARVRASEDRLAAFALDSFRLRVPPGASDDTLLISVNGELVREHVVGHYVELDRNTVHLPLRAGDNLVLVRAYGSFGGFAFSLLPSKDELGGVPLDVLEALQAPDAPDAPETAAPVRAHYRRHVREEGRALWRELEALRDERLARQRAIPVTLVTQERERPVRAHVLERGRYDLPGEEVLPGTPASLPALAPGVPGATGASVAAGASGDDARPATRLDLARWLVAPGHPLTARVTVNRFWQELFGAGLVETSEDFGFQGAYPSHPELLDWLALELVESDWDVKALVRLLVTSATYRQDGTASEEKWRVDPENRLLSRGPRGRLDAERIRDSALAISGLLVERIGGPSVRPYQPPGLWKPLAYVGSNTGEFRRDEGDALYRRSLYTFWKRTSPPPTMRIFDAPTREACTPRRARTNTPLQALALMNDEQFVEAARALAQRLLHEVPDSDEARVVRAYRLATARRPDPEEERVVLALLAEATLRFAQDRAAAEELIGVGASEPDAGLDPARLAAWTVVANMILNLDETITKG